jgi:quercetin 2,3-dioxygenase
MTLRRITRIIPAVSTSDGAGVRLRRSLGARPDLRLDPFLLLDEFYSDDPNDYLAGFPSHPHRRVRNGDLHARRADAP